MEILAMIWRIRIALLTSVVVASAFCSVVRADEKLPADEKKEPPVEKKEEKKEIIAAPHAPVAHGCGAPAYQTVCVTEWVPEYYKTTRTTYKSTCVQERYTAYRHECVPEVRTRN